MKTIDFGENTELWFDRLTCGELDENTRQSLLGWLDAQPLRWRGCALAFLEAQTWSESLGSAELAEGHEPCEGTLQPGQATRGKHHDASAFRWASLAALAALLLVTFSLGALSRGWIVTSNGGVVENMPPLIEKRATDQDLSGPLMATVSLRPNLGSGMPATLQIPVRSVQDSEPFAASSPISDYDRQKWERRGYQLTKERRFLPAQLPGGKKVVVPVEQLKANYVGSRVS